MASEARGQADLVPAPSHLVARTIFVVRVEYVLDHEEGFSLFSQRWNWISETSVSHREGLDPLVIRLAGIPV